MINLQMKLELQTSAQQWADSIMSQYGISAAEMEDALNKVILNLHPRILQNYLEEQQKAYQDTATTTTVPEEVEN